MGKIKYKVPATSFEENDKVDLFAFQLNSAINKNDTFYDSIFKGLSSYLENSSYESFNLNDNATIITKKYYSNERYMVANPYKLRIFELNGYYYQISNDRTFENKNYYELDETEEGSLEFGPKDLGLWMKEEEALIMTNFDVETGEELREFRGDKEYFELYNASPKNLVLYELIDLCQEESFANDETYWHRQYNELEQTYYYEVASPVVLGLYEFDDETGEYILSSDTFFDVDNKTYYLDYSGSEIATPMNLLLYVYSGEYEPGITEDPIFVLSQDEEFKQDYNTGDIKFYYIYLNNDYEIATPYKCNQNYSSDWLAYRVYIYQDETAYAADFSDEPFNLSTDYKTTDWWESGRLTPSKLNLCEKSYEQDESYRDPLTINFEMPMYYKMGIRNPLSLSLYEKINNEYVPSEDETFIEGKTYYMFDWGEVNPFDLGLYEFTNQQYVLTEDENFYFGKQYYIKDFSVYVVATPQNLNLYDDLGETKSKDISFNPFSNAVYYSLDSILNRKTISIKTENNVIVLKNQYDKNIKIENLSTQASPSNENLIAIKNDYTKYINKINLQTGDPSASDSESKSFIANVSQTSIGKLEMGKKNFDVVQMLNYSNHILKVSKNFNREETYKVIDYKRFYCHNIVIKWHWTRKVPDVSVPLQSYLWVNFEIINNMSQKFSIPDFFTEYENKKMNCIVCQSINDQGTQRQIVDSFTATIGYENNKPAITVHFLNLYKSHPNYSYYYNSPKIDYTLYFTDGVAITDSDGGISFIDRLQESDFLDVVTDATSVTTY